MFSPDTVTNPLPIPPLAGSRPPGDHTLPVAARSTRGRGRRNNEDAVLAAPPVLAVSDGVGGAPGGELASAAALRGLVSVLTHPPAGAPPAVALQRAFAVANAEVRTWSHQTGTEGMAATLVAAIVGRSSVAIANVGDSRAYLWRAGCLQRLTRDHRLIEELSREGVLDQEARRRHPQRNLITRAVGLHPILRPDITHALTRPGDLLLLCSDGLTDPVPDAALAALCAEPDLEALTDRLVRAARGAGGRDDTSVIVARL